MSKKPRRLRTPNLPPQAFAEPQSVPTPSRAVQVAVSNTPVGSASGAETAPKAVNWQAEYGAVLGDLKRTGILAATLLIIMIVLSVIIR
ncbi:MAG: hypothetical protein RMN25_01395 [Anaerolineae bacterium]|nr:hypothetical protein [Thermoflexales bacterium]MDW8406410.1 hypothetical protein [Anaerolineae bacterium]